MEFLGSRDCMQKLKKSPRGKPDVLQPYTGGGGLFQFHIVPSPAKVCMDACITISPRTHLLHVSHANLSMQCYLKQDYTLLRLLTCGLLSLLRRVLSLKCDALTWYQTREPQRP